MMMTTRERIRNTLNFKPVDRLPVIEWAPWWNLTIDRWHTEGLPGHLSDPFEIRNWFGLDPLQYTWVRPIGPDCPHSPEADKGTAWDMDRYRRLKKYLFPENAFDKSAVTAWAQKHRAGEWGVWISLDGFFWFPRSIFGIEEHFCAFYDNPELMHAMNRDLLDFNLRVLDEFCSICAPDFMSFGEDMSYNKGTMISKSLFDEFMAPYYRKIIPRLKEYGIIPLVDSDGDIEEIIPWMMEVGLEGILPLEHQAGVDIVDLRKKFPTFRMLGAFDKMVMVKSEDEVRAEFERILPVMRQGGYIPGVDHQTPPGVSLEQYRIYLGLLNEYCRKASR